MGGKRAVSAIVHTIMGVVIAVIFVLIAASVLEGYLSQFPRVSGALGDTSTAVCFGGGTDHHMHCLEKLTGTELFSVGSGTGWGDGKQNAESTPVLTKDGIYFGLGDRFCAYSAEGMNKWGSCIDHGSEVNAKAGVSQNDEGLVCYEGSGKLRCYNKDTGEIVFYTEQAYSRITTPVIDEQGFVYVVAELVDGTHNFRDVCVFPPRTTGEVERNTYCKSMNYGRISDAVVYNETICLLTGTLVTGTMLPAYKCFDKDKNMIASFDVNYNFKDEVVPNSWSPAIDCEWMYYLGSSAIYRTNLKQVQDTKAWNYEKVLDMIPSTQVAASGDMICFGQNEVKKLRGKDAGTVYCYNMTSGKYQVKVSALESWDDYKAETTPAIIGDKVYLAIGDHAFSYDMNGTSYWDADGIDFDHQIPTDIGHIEFELGVNQTWIS